ncbi:hypothetical protein [Lacticaseibacillus sp. N501-2]|uniref:hypothetical protein n=1 Tax=Lacticaseibacillus salsurae TaxID=3367729 RepID=UPI0038B362DD
MSKSISELTADAQQKALSDFIDFYLDKYRNEGLDLIAQADTTGHIADINAWLMDNRSFSREELAAGLLRERGANLIALLNTINAPFNDNGLPETPWNEWFKSDLQSIPQGR